MAKTTKQPAPTAAAMKERALKKLAELDKKLGTIDQGLARLPKAATASLPAIVPEKPNNNLTIECDAEDSESDEKAEVRTIMHPVVGASITMMQYDKHLRERNVNDVVKEISKHVTDVQTNNMNRPEAILVCQAQTLDIMFGELARRAALHMGSSTDKMEAYMRQALRVQSQCRATIETLAEIKNPRTPTFVKQQNVANQQQVNNGVPAPRSRAHGAEKMIMSNELLEGGKDGQWMDAGTAGTAGGGDQAMGAVAEVDRAEDVRRQVNKQSKRTAARSKVG